MRLRFDEREIALLKSAERLRGSTYAHRPKADALRTALTLARAGQKIAHAAPGAAVSLEEGEVGLLIEAVRYASGEIQVASRAVNGQDSERQHAVLAAFPELVEKGAWRSFGLSRELEAIAARLHAALSS